MSSISKGVKVKFSQPVQYQENVLQSKSFIDERGSTTLSKHIWRLKDEGTDYQVRWEIVRRAEQFLPVTGKCNLCIEEKQEIIFNPDLSTLNSLRHKKKKNISKRVV